MQLNAAYHALNLLGPFEPSVHLAVAVSGGADSMALCLLAQDWARARGGNITALTVDHALRPEAASEVLQVERWLHARDIACIRMQVKVAREGNLQANARDARYNALLAWCRAHHVLHLLIGHHAHDLAETSVLHQMRGDTSDGASGLAAVTRRAGVRILRPLLTLRKEVLMAYLQSQAQPWLEDPSNVSDAFARSRLRKTLAVEEALAEAKRAGRARHMREMQHAQDAGAVAVIFPEGYGVLKRECYTALPEIRATHLLANMIRCIGQKISRPRQHETLRLHARIHAQGAFRATLGKCRILADAEKITLLPEAVHSVRALWHLDQIGAVPHIGEVQPHMPQAACVRFNFSPPMPLAASAFWSLD